MALRYNSIFDFPEHLRPQVEKLCRQDDERRKQRRLQTSAIQNDLFDSDGEREYYHEFLMPGVEAGRFTNVRQQVAFEVLPAFTMSDGRHMKNIIYTADFVYTDVEKCKDVIVEVKAKKKIQVKTHKNGKVSHRQRSFTDTEASRIRWKLLQYKFRDEPNVVFRKWYRGQPYE